MTRNSKMPTGIRRLVRGGAVLALVVAIGACEENRTVTLEPVGPASFDFNVISGAAGLPSGTVISLGAGGAVVTASNLPALGGGAVYQLWTADQDASGAAEYSEAFAQILEFFLRDSLDAAGAPVTDPLTGEVIQVVDTTDVGADLSTYGGISDEAVFAVEFFIDATNAANAGITFPENTVLLTIETAAAAAPGAARFLWAKIGDGFAGGPMNFGNFGGPDKVNAVSPLDYVYGVTGNGLGGIRGDEISVDLQEMSAPPVGFYYVGILTDTLGARVVVDTLRSAYSPVAAQSRVSMFNADQGELLPGVAGTRIRASQIRNCVSGSGVNGCQNSLGISGDEPFRRFATFNIALAVKSAAGIDDAAITHSGEVPEPVRRGETDIE